MQLAELIDLEARIAADADADPEALRARDRALYQSWPDPPEDREALLVRWIHALRAARPGPSPGAQVRRGQRLAGYALVALGLALGASTAAGLLRFSGGEDPINVGWFLVAVVGVQLGLLALTLVGLPLLARYPHAPLLGETRALARWLGRRLERSADLLDPAQRRHVEVTRARLATRASLYRRVERWLLLAHTQSFGVAFNVGVLLVCLRLVFVTDLPFAWSTTVQGFDAEAVHRLTALLARPFGWLLPDAVPTAELVAATQYSRLTQAYVQGTPDPRLVGGWWPFLVAAAVTYGLLPRLALWSLARVQLARALGDLPLGTVEVDRIVRRLTTPDVRTAPHELAPQGAPPAPSAPGAPAAAATDAADVVRWREPSLSDEALARVVRDNFGCEVRASHAREAATEVEVIRGPVVVVADAWEPPDKGVRRFLAALRAQIGAQTRLVVALVGEPEGGDWRPPRPEDVALWQDRLTLNRDPYLAVEALR